MPVPLQVSLRLQVATDVMKSKPPLFDEKIVVGDLRPIALDGKVRTIILMSE